MEITGTFQKASDIKTFESGFQAQEFYLDCKTYNQYTGEPIENLIKVYFSVKGKLYDKEDGTKGHFQNLNIWKIEAIETKKNTPSITEASPQDFEEIEDDLPF